MLLGTFQSMLLCL